MWEQVSPCPAINPRQCAHKIPPSSSVMIHRETVGSFIFLEWRTFAKTTCLLAMISPWTLFYKSRDQLVICLKTFKGFKLFLSVVADFKNKIRNEVNRLGRRKTFGIVIRKRSTPMPVILCMYLFKQEDQA